MTPAALARAAAFAALLCLPLSSHAIFRAYLASTGSDANPCTLQQPCRLLPRALSVVDEGGEIWMMDSANYNTTTVEIGKPVSIQAVPGAVGSVVGVGDAIVISLRKITVSLRNLTIVPFSGTGRGISIGVNDALVIVKDCEIAGMGAEGILMTGNSTLHVIDTVIRGSGLSGIRASKGTLHVSRSHLVGNFYGLGLTGDLASTVVGHVDASVAASNEGDGFAIFGGPSGTREVRLHVTRSVASGNGGVGFYVGGPDATLEVSGSEANGNGLYGFQNQVGILRTPGDNHAAHNGAGPVDGPITAAGAY